VEQIKRYKAVITGNVQGVGLRVFVVDNASKLGITGWVRNMADGTVEMEAQGNPDKLDQLFATIKKGNFIIKVDNIDYTEIDCVEETSFIIKY
jgi:acylphosphatase